MLKTRNLKAVSGLAESPLWVYRTEDDSSVVETAGYFYTINSQMQIGDRVVVNYVTDPDKSTEAFVSQSVYVVSTKPTSSSHPELMAGNGGAPYVFAPVTAYTTTSYGFAGSVSDYEGVEADTFGFTAPIGAMTVGRNTVLGLSTCRGIVSVDGAIWEYVQLQSNAYLSSVKFRFTPSVVGTSWPGATVQGRKLNPTVLPAHPSQMPSTWQLSGELTDASATIPAFGAGGAPVAGVEFELDVTELTHEMMGRDWTDTDYTYSLVIVPVSACTTAQQTLTWPRVDGNGEPVTFLDVISYEASADPYAPLNHAHIGTYRPDSVADMSDTTDVYRIVPTNRSGGVARVSIKTGAGSGGRSLGLDPAYTADVLPIRYAANRSTVYNLGGAGSELDSAKWNPNSSGQPLVFGWADPPIIGYLSQLQMRHETNDYLYLLTMNWTSTESVTDWWDVASHSSGTSDQSAIFLTADASSETVSFDCVPGNDSGGTKTFTGVTTGAGRTLTAAYYTSHVDGSVEYRLWVRDAAGAIVLTKTASVTVFTVNGFLTGWAWSGGPQYGSIILDFHGDARAIWEDTAKWMSLSWIRGIKSLDPRLMR